VHNPHEGIHGRTATNSVHNSSTELLNDGRALNIQALLGIRNGSIACTTGDTKRGTDKVS